ncbi:actin-like ATPase domain-containing protein, partial [Tilletiaria anomala UBC 951]
MVLTAGTTGHRSKVVQKSRMESPSLLLCLNVGSTSLKFSVYRLQDDLPVLLAGSLQPQKDSFAVGVRITKGYEGAKAKWDANDHELVLNEYDFNSPSDQFAALIHLMRICPAADKDKDLDLSPDKLSLVVHRVVHGANMQNPIHIRAGHRGRLEQLEKLNDFAPLHNKPATTIIEAALEQLPEHTWQLVYTDTEFHYCSIPPHIYTLPIPQHSALPGGQPPRKWGFHGLAYSFVVRQAAAFIGQSVDQTNLIACHLGGGCSVCAIRDGRSLDTSMSFTPLDGLPGATRSGSVDPCLGFHLTTTHAPKREQIYQRPDGKQPVTEIYGVSISTPEYILNKESGFKALAHTTAFNEIVLQMSSSQGKEREQAKLAFALFVDRLADYIGAYWFKLVATGAKVNALVFSGGIGQNSDALHAALADRFKSTPMAPMFVSGSERGHTDNASAIVDLVGDIHSDHVRKNCAKKRNGVRWLVCH